jgi:hypothetical protein
MAIIQNIKFGNYEVIISVGFFLAKDLKQLAMTHPVYVEDYEPLPRKYQEHLVCIGNNKFIHCIKKAVCGSKDIKSGLLEVKSTKSFIRQDNQKSEEILGNSVRVKMVSLESIIEKVYKKYHRIDKLLINCEGSEIEIINETPLHLFSHCKFLFVQFHDFLPVLNIQKQDIQKCLKKLETVFRKQITNAKYSKYNFYRKDNHDELQNY